MLERLFKLSENNTTVKTEVVAGFTTFLTMAYIIFVNPSMLADAGMDKGAVFVATCLAAAIGCLLMGVLANYPVALAPGMGLNAFFAYVVVGSMGYSWQTALGAVFLSGCCFIFLSAFKIREWLVNAIPLSLRMGIAAGIGLFLAIIALKNSGVVVDHPVTLVKLGDVSSFPVLMTALGFVLIVALEARKVPGAVMIGVLAVAAIALVTGHTEFTGVVATPPSIAPTFMQLDIAGAFDVAMISVIFAFLFVDLFDTSGTLVAVVDRARLTDEDGKLPRLNRALLADSGASVAGSVLGTSTTTSYIESGAGVAAGGRTGLTAVVVGCLFLVALFFSPLAGMIPAYATAGALLYVAVLMTHGLTRIDWDDITEAAPVVVATIMTPLSFSIAHGIALGFITYALIKLISGRFSDVTVSVWVLAAIFVAKYAFLPAA